MLSNTIAQTVEQLHTATEATITRKDVDAVVGRAIACAMDESRAVGHLGPSPLNTACMTAIEVLMQYVAQLEEGRQS